MEYYKLNNIHSQHLTNKDIPEINYIKSLSILFVILLHSIKSNYLLLTLSPFHIWHAVPIFMIIAGMNGTISSYKDKVLNNKNSIFLKIYSSMLKLLIPFITIWIIEIFILYIQDDITIKKTFYSLFTGGFGPGSYFTPLFIQHILFFPIILWAKKILSRQNTFTSLSLFFCISICLELTCILLRIPDSIYRLLYVRYFFAAVLGSYIVDKDIKLNYFLILSIFSAIYILLTSYFDLKIFFIYNSWRFHHAPAYFYSLFIISILWNSYHYLKKYDNFFKEIGKSTYHIFLVQMVFFNFYPSMIKVFFHNNILIILINLFFCIFTGILFYKSQKYVMQYFNLKTSLKVVK